MGLPDLPMACTANPTSSATSSVCRTTPLVKEENSVSGIRCSRKSAVVVFSAAAGALPAARFSPSPGWMMLPTTRPMARATVDMATK